MNKIKKLTLIAIMSALCFVSFTYLHIKVPTPTGYTSIHLGNACVVLVTLLTDGITGGLAGAIGMGIGDLLDPAYVITAPKTIILKFMIGYITGLVAHKVFHIKEKEGSKLLAATIVSVSCGMLFNMIGEPVISYLYYDLLLSNSEKAQSYLTALKFITTGVNSILAIVISTLLYLPISKRFQK